jgi:hypothetical protein
MSSARWDGVLKTDVLSSQRDHSSPALKGGVFWPLLITPMSRRFITQEGGGQLESSTPDRLWGNR